jgi:hypothetical protein
VIRHGIRWFNQPNPMLRPRGTKRPSSAPQGQNYYLDPSHGSASDANDGTSESAPWATLAAVDGAFAPGSTINIRAGLTYNGELTITASGSAGSPVTFTSYGAGAKPLFNAPGDSAIRLDGAQYVIVDGLAATSAARGGVKIEADSHDYIVRNCTVSNSGFGMEIYGPNGLFQSNTVSDLVMVVNTPGGDDDYGACAFVVMETHDLEFSGNLVQRCKAVSSDYGYDGGGFETWRTCSNIHIHHNWVDTSNGFIEFGGLEGDTVSNILIERNTAVNNGLFHWINSGVGAYTIDVLSLEIRYNTIFSDEFAGVVFGWQDSTPPGAEYSFHHNIVDYVSAGTIFNLIGVTNRSTNCYHGSFWIDVDGDDLQTGEIKADPLFVDPGAFNFNLQPGSPAAGMGANA